MRCRYGASVEQSNVTLKEVLATVVQVLESGFLLYLRKNNEKYKRSPDYYLALTDGEAV